MARGGINKALVGIARQSVLGRGQNPSIDAVRVELGNTGSKTTIHRYLKEIEEEDDTRLDDEALLSQRIREQITSLASSLREGAQATIEQSRDQYKNRIEGLNSENKELRNANELLQKELENKILELKEVSDKFCSQEKTEEELKKRVVESEQTEIRLQALLDEKQSQIDSLEEKHLHSREALDHYRQSVKEQRDQDLRKHEQQLQTLQTEIRALNQTLSVKQTDITQLNKDNSRLVSELGSTRKIAASEEISKQKLESHVRELDAQIRSAHIELDLLNDYASEKESLAQELNKVTADYQSSIITIAKLESEVKVKNEMINRLMNETSKPVEDAPIGADDQQN